MNFLKPEELRHTLKISRSTEQRLLKHGMPSLGIGRLRRYEEEAAVEWFRRYAEQSHAPEMLAIGEYECRQCRFTGVIEKPAKPGPCPACGSSALPRKITGTVSANDNARQLR